MKLPHAPFVHLHVHSGFSLLNSTVRLEALIQRAQEYRMPALALTDQGNLFAAIAFYGACIKAGIKPILGAQVYVVPDRRRRDVRPDREVRDQLILLCRDQEGWRSLMRLVTAGHLEGSHERPRVDPELLARHNRGLLALSAGPKGEVGRLLAADQADQAREAVVRLETLYRDPSSGAPGFYLEIQRHGLPGEEAVNGQTIRLAHEMNIPLVASNDVHFLDPRDHRAHDALLCVGLGFTLYDEKRPRFTERYAFAAAGEMAALFADVPEALANTLHIAKRCNLQLDLGHTVLPDYQPPDGEDLASRLRQEARRGLDRRLEAHVFPGQADPERAALKKQYHDRLDFELEVIGQMGFPGYFLIVSDFIRWAKSNDIPVGPGRGSGAGSVVAWSMDITDLDPLRYQLLFERFLNPERVSMPDFDVDFCMDRRERVIRYVQDKYGADRVAQIITFGTLQARAVIRDVGRVLEMPYGRVDRIAKLVPNVLGITLKQAIEQEERLRQMMADEPEVRELLELALSLEGLPRSAGTHAAGVVMANGPLTDMVPLYLDPRSDMPVTQFNMVDVERAGLVKFDFLGLKTLTVIDDVLRIVNGERKPEEDGFIDINRIGLEDTATFDLLKEGQTRGVFQLESSGMREILKKLAPDTFEEIIALVALYRPGPLGSGMVDDFINRKHGRIEVVYPHPSLEPILKETFGVILYQEQVMKIAQELAGYSLGGADLLRRAMGKKKLKEMLSQREAFMKGAEANGIHPERAAFIFDLMEKFAGYGFNKSHSAAYALISYQTAWLKAHHPVAFMSAVLTNDMLNTDKVIQFVRECRSLKIPLYPPDVNRSGIRFAVEGEGVRHGLAAIKNVGEAAVASLLRTREEGGRFTSLFDLCARVVGLNKRVLEHLIKAGACDELSDGAPGNRAALLAGLEQALGQGSRQQEEQALGFLDLFGGLEEERPKLPERDDLREEQRLAFEKEALGFHLSGHPMGRFETELAGYGLVDIKTLRERFRASREPKSGVRVAGLVADRKLHRTRKGDRMAFFTLEDREGQLEVTVFSEVFERDRALLEKDGLLVVTGTMEPTEDDLRMTVEEMVDLEGFRRKHCREMRLRVDALTLTGGNLDKMERTLSPHVGGHCRVVLELSLPGARADIRLGAPFRVTPCEALLEEMRALLGEESVSFHSGMA